MAVTARRQKSAGCIELESDDQRSVLGASEELIHEESVFFDLLIGTQIICHLTALTKQTLGANGVYRVRVGGTSGAADGVITTTMTTTHAAYVPPGDHSVSSPFARPTGIQLVKLTANASSMGALARIKGFQIAFIAI